jgi:xanthine dehydrogenase YagR molybdenum-binding subunit
MKILQKAAQAVLQKAVENAPDALIPGGMPDPLVDEPHALIGAPVPRVDGAVKVRGAAPFAAEFALDAMTYAALVHSTIAKGRIATLDTAAAQAAPGVVLVMTHRNAPPLQPVPMFLSQPKAAGGDNLPVFQDDRVHWNGQPVAVVLAETQEQADHAKSLVRVTYHAEEAVTSLAAAKARGTEDTLFQGEPLNVAIGDAEAALAASPHRVDAQYRTPRLNHNAIELHAATVAWHGDELRVHDATQAVAHTAWSLGQVFGIRQSQVHVTSPFVGGRLRRQGAVAAPGAGRRRGETGGPAGAHRAAPRGGVPDGRRPHVDRAARGAWRRRRRPPHGADPYRHGRDDGQ